MTGDMTGKQTGKPTGKTTAFTAVILEEVDSTQDEARDRFLAGDGRPTLVVAARQTRGRGRGGAAWTTAPAAVAASLAYRPGWPTESWPLITLAAGTAAVRVLRGAGRGGVRLKWPNDIFLGERKAGGILTEAGPGLATAGWGANLFWPRPPPGAAGLWEERPPPGRAESLARGWAEELLSLTGGGTPRWPREEYRRDCATLGREITWLPGGRGRAVDVNEDGGLVVETARGTIVLTAGEIKEVRPVSGL